MTSLHRSKEDTGGRAENIGTLFEPFVFRVGTYYWYRKTTYTPVPILLRRSMRLAARSNGWLADTQQLTINATSFRRNSTVVTLKVSDTSLSDES